MNKMIYNKIKLVNIIILNENIINELNTKMDFAKINKEMLNFFKDNYKDLKLINLMNKLIILSFGEVIHLYKKYFIPEQEDKQNYEDSLLSKNKSFLFSNLINEKKNIIVVEKNKKENEEKTEKENDEIINHKNMLKEEYKNSFIYIII